MEQKAANVMPHLIFMNIQKKNNALIVTNTHTKKCKQDAETFTSAAASAKCCT